MDWNTTIIINEPENIEMPNEESVQFNQEPEPIKKEIDSVLVCLKPCWINFSFTDRSSFSCSGLN